MNSALKKILNTVPSAPDWAIDRAALEETALSVMLSSMKNVQQNPAFHGEGDVFSHTMAVCGALSQAEEFRSLPERQRQEVFLAALLHDVGKLRTTRLDNGEWVSPRHSKVGAQMARDLLWRECGLCGTPEAQAFRETVCSLISYHSVPVHVLGQEDGALRLMRIASEGLAAGDFSLELLCLLSESDVRGRIAPDTEELSMQVRLCALMAEELGCLKGVGNYASAYTRRAYLSGRNVLPDQAVYDDTWGEVILMCGLPAAGKDTWISTHYPDLPMISLDYLRKEMHMRPEDNPAPVVREAEERAKELLRKKQPFIWNATSLTRDLRGRRISLFERYHAAVRIVYLETDRETQRQRNRGRAATVPEAVIERMLFSLEPPMPWEAQEVDWICT
ncbi:MAG: AAA family ATPase [Oscillospiraceae bacterium]|nr:AAA family ATPase [Oscillospiraceae bacterium]